MTPQGTDPRYDSETNRVEGRVAGDQRTEAEDLSLCVIGDGSLATFPLPAGCTAIVGRSGDADIRIEDPSISRRHARIRNGAPPVIEDLGSANGTRVGDRRIDPGELVDLSRGDVITLGNIALILRRQGPRVAPQPQASAPAAATTQSQVIATSPQMKQLFDLARRVADSALSVLILGETGVGKEVMAEMLHRHSRRADKPLLRLNCGAFSDSLLESELFGHEKGAFTGAVQTKMGLLESADGGTVFLDEVGEMPASLQVKLLRVLEERRITRVGGLKSRPIDVRLIAATHRSLEAEIARGAFRQDLFFRLNGISLTIPPLRERLEELEGLARLFLEQAAQRTNRPRAPRLTDEVLTLLQEHDWPGNIRELRNLMERAVVLCTGDELTREHLSIDQLKPRSALQRKSVPPPPPTLRSDALEALAGVGSLAFEGPTPAPSDAAGGDDERRRILAALEQCAGNQTHAARLLGISRSTLILRLDHYNLPRPRRGRGEPKV